MKGLKFRKSVLAVAFLIALVATLFAPMDVQADDCPNGVCPAVTVETRGPLVRVAAGPVRFIRNREPLRKVGKAVAATGRFVFGRRCHCG